jgi:hypothetical protein
MRTTIELSDRTYALLRARAAERGMRGFSPLVEKALENLLDRSTAAGVDAALAVAEGAWSEADVEEWERARANPSGLAALAGALADWEDLDDVVEEIYATRRASADRPAPDLD